jgi:phage baseplate assembly protein W
MQTRADKYTQVGKKQEFYSDFMNNFVKHPVTNTLAKLTNEESVKQSIRNLILTNVGERMFEPDVGSTVNNALFEPNDFVSKDMMAQSINYAINTFEPRARLLSVKIDQTRDGNSLVANIVFSLINSQEPVTLQLLLRRIR